MTEVFERILQSYGTSVTVERNGQQTSCLAFVQPVRSAAKHAERTGPLGRYGANEAVWIGPADVPVDGASILRAGERWRVRRWEQICVGNETVYLWAALTREGEVDGFAGA